ncbi:MAG: glycosyltransferase family 2 protein [Candidatus Hodarchaeota archaeon]
MEANMPLDLSVIIVNYNTADFLVRCLNSVASQSGIDSEVIVVDNCSQDGSSELLKNNFSWIKLITNDRNLGFSRANNQALKMCSGKYVYYLNPDTEVRPDAFKAMVDYMESRPDIGLAGTRIVNPDGSLQQSVENRYPGQKYAVLELKDLTKDIAWVLGASMIARRELIQALEGFDESFFLYGEDLDLCMRIRKAGWSIGYIPDAVVVHWGGQSERDSLPVEVWEKKFKAESIFYHKHYSSKTIRAIERANLAQAYWRILTLSLMLPFSGNQEKIYAKMEKYQLTVKMLKNTKKLND